MAATAGRLWRRPPAILTAAARWAGGRDDIAWATCRDGLKSWSRVIFDVAHDAAEITLTGRLCARATGRMLYVRHVPGVKKRGYY